MATESVTASDGPPAAGQSPAADQIATEDQDLPKDQDLVWSAFVEAARIDAERRAKDNRVLSGAGEMQQRSADWHQLRATRFTASALPNVMGWFGRGALENLKQIWAEKVGLETAPPGEVWFVLFCFGFVGGLRFWIALVVGRRDGCYYIAAIPLNLQHIIQPPNSHSNPRPKPNPQSS